jgi:hypothetical protein
VTDETPPVPPSSLPLKRLADDWAREVQASYSSWASAVGTTRSGLVSPEGAAQYTGLPQEALVRRINEAYSSLNRVQASMSDVIQNGVIIQEIAKMKTAYAELQVLVLGGYPPDRLSELTGTIAVALVSGGGIAYALKAGLLAASVLWALGIFAVGFTIAARAIHQKGQMAEYKARLLSL